MSTKLNAEELAEKMFPSADKDLSFSQPWREAAKHTIRNIAQPIANERDEALDALSNIASAVDHKSDLRPTLDAARAILAKYQNQANKEHA